MLSGYRYIVIASFGWLSLAASPLTSEREKPGSSTDNQIGPALENIAESLREANEGSALDSPCEEGKDQRSSDLCAQWKAADSAKSSADATWLFGMLGSLIGSLTLAAAASAAKWARKAAEHTETGAIQAGKANITAERMGKAQVRAHLSVQNPEFVISPDGRWTATYEIRNNGQTPAKDIQFYARAYFIRINPDLTQTGTSTSPVMKLVKDIVRDGNPSLTISGQIDRAYVDKMTSENAMLTLVSSAEFTDIFNDRHEEPSAFSVPVVQYGAASELINNSGYMWFAKHIHTITGFTPDEDEGGNGA